MAAPFTVAKTWKQPRYPSTNEWIEMWCMYTMECYSVKNKNEIVPFAATQMQLDIIIVTEVRQRATNSIWHHLYCRCLVAKLCLTLCDPINCSMPGFPVPLEFAQSKLMSIMLVMPSNYLILCCPLLLLLSIFSRIRVFSNESALCIR